VYVCLTVCDLETSKEIAPPRFGMLRHRKEFILREPVSQKGHGRFVPVQPTKVYGEWRYRTASALDGDAWSS
jgi:hypothetical protein